MKKSILLIITIIFIGSCCKKEKSWPIYSALFDVQYVAHARYFNDSLKENSMPLFRFLVEDMKYRIVECDVVFTKDNVPVLMHNTKVSDLAIINHKYIQNNVEVDDITYKELLNCDFSMGGG